MNIPWYRRRERGMHIQDIKTFFLFTRMHVDLDGLYIMFLPLFLRVCRLPVIHRFTYNLWRGFWLYRRSGCCFFFMVEWLGGMTSRVTTLDSIDD